jgi:hypothetical protein
VEAGDLGFALRKRGVTAKTVDLTAAHDFRAMQKAGIAYNSASIRSLESDPPGIETAG